MRWDVQNRDDRALSWSESAQRFTWPTAIGLAATLAFATYAPGALPFASPILLGLTLSIPFAKLTAAPALGRWMNRRGLHATPEEINPTMEMRLAGYGPPAALHSADAHAPIGAATADAPLDR